MVATLRHLPERAQALILSGWRRRDREEEGSGVGHCPQTGSVHLVFGARHRLRRGSLEPVPFLLVLGIVAVEEQQRKSGSREVNRKLPRQDSHAMIHLNFRSKASISGTFDTSETGLVLYL